MGGIFCATALNDVIPSVMQGLADLEYGDYDSAGLGILADRQIQRYRAQGPLSALAALLVDEPVSSKTVIGHMRGATHGEPARHNAHPHASSRVAVVHNGIIENHAELRAELEREGAQFRSETDSEVIVWMLDRELANRAHPLVALQNVLLRLQGSYALGVICMQAGNRVYATRRGSPLAVGRARGASWLASDPAALRRVAHESVSLEDGQIAELSPSQVHIFDSHLEQLAPRWTRIVTPSSTQQSGEHQIVTNVTHKQIVEQPAILGRTLRELQGDLASGELEGWCGPLWRADRILAIGSGSSYYAAYAARAWLEQIAGIPVELELSSELRTRKPILTEGTIALLVSQSGETADSLEALRYLKKRNVPTVALVGRTSSAMAREADAVLDCRAGQETGIALPQAFTAQLCALAAASIVIRQLKHGGSQSEGMPASIFGVPQAMMSALELEDQCAGVGRRIAEANHAIYLGRGANYPLALEGALKLKALSHVRAEVCAAGEFKYGPLALIERGTPVVVVAPHDATFDETLSDVRQVIARGGEPILVGDSHIAEIAKRDGLRCIAAGRVDPVWSPLVLAVPLQLIAYHAASVRDRHLSSPRNLARSLTTASVVREIRSKAQPELQPFSRYGQARDRRDK
jgi:glucosamine--fructose-6-phosphate aminotransferase (isomerizing)